MAEWLLPHFEAALTAASSSWMYRGNQTINHRSGVRRQSLCGRVFDLHQGLLDVFHPWSDPVKLYSGAGSGVGLLIPPFHEVQSDARLAMMMGGLPSVQPG
jgi:hypothetical protein